MGQQDYNPMLEVCRTIGLMFGIGKRPAPPTPAEIAKQQLDQAEIELLEAEQVKEAAFANVEKLKARVRRLKADPHINNRNI